MDGGQECAYNNSPINWNVGNNFEVLRSDNYHHPFISSGNFNSNKVVNIENVHCIVQRGLSNVNMIRLTLARL